MNKNKALSIAGAVVSVVSMVLPFVSNYFESKQQDELIAKKVAEALAKANKDN